MMSTTPLSLARAGALVLVLAVLAGGLAGCDPASVYGPLTGQWTASQHGYPIAAKPAVGSGTAYVGSWDGNEYAYDEASGALRWHTYLGVTEAVCGGTHYFQGVTSSPWLENGGAYLGGGGGYWLPGASWDALDAATGAVLWTVPTGDNSITGGHYNWSSPVVYAGHAFVGIASFCDEPLVQGELLRVDLATHQIQNVFKVVPDGQLGGTIWTNPAIDPATNTAFLATGNRDGPNQPYAQAVVSLDATTLAVKGAWSLPPSDTTVDADFSSSPVLFTDSRGRTLVAASNKNGMLYALQRNNLNAGPLWQTRLALSTDSAGGGSFSTGFFDGQRLYYAAGETTIGGQTYGGSIRALDPATGAVLWERGLPAQVYGALAGANGMIAAPSSDGGLYVLSASDGRVLYANGLTGVPRGPAIFAAPTIADGYLFIGTTDGVVHAFVFPSVGGAGQGVRAARSDAAAPRARAARCVGTRGAVVRADCRLAVTARHCVRLGQLPAAVGAIVVDGLKARQTGGARDPARLRVYANGSCAGRALVRLRLIHGGATRRFRRWTLPPAAVLSLAATHRLHLDLRAVGRHARATTAPSRILLRPPIGP
jgi:outer membrane protein assembly factor BamB